VNKIYYYIIIYLDLLAFKFTELFRNRKENNYGLLLKEMVISHGRFRKVTKSATCTVFHKISMVLILLINFIKITESNLTIHRSSYLYSKEKY